MKRILSLLLVCLFCAGMLSACKDTVADYDAIKKAGKLVIGITIYEPMNYYEADGKTLTGFDTDFAKAVCEKLGVEPVFQIIDWDMKETELKAKNIDCIWNGLTVTEERRENMDFTDTYLLNRQCVVINKKDAAKYTSTSALAAALVTAESGSAGETAVKADANLKNSNYTGSDSQASALVALNAGNFDAAVIDYTLAKASVGNGDYANLIIVDSITLENEEYAIGFRVGSDMTAKVNDIIADLIADGTLTGIAAKYDLTELYEAAVNK